MQTANDLKTLLSRIDRRSYPAYKDTREIDRFPGCPVNVSPSRTS